MKNLKIYFVESEFENEKILGREAREYVLSEFDEEEYEIVKSFSDISPTGFPYVILSLDMPLITKEYLIRLLKTASKQKIGRCVLGGEHSEFCLVLGEGRKTYFVEDKVFLQLGGAKSYNMVYNTLRKRINSRLIKDGVILLGEEFHIDDTAIVESGATLISPTTLRGKTIVKSGAMVENSIVLDSTIESFAQITCSHLTSSYVGENSTVGPFARLREGKILENCRIGDFVEVKNSILHNGVKCAHLAYVGDAEVGERTNVGCGSVFCNYDGKNKHRTYVGNEVFIGANVNFVAPLKIGDGTYIAAGTTVTKDTAENGFVIGRVRQENKGTKQK
ncbi:MAG: hypothetical protein J6V37_00305 [Clostridia bacterium]|nr:hypothetical protein [Clostridia bacterium]